MMGLKQVGKALRITYEEPTTNMNGSALKDLQHTVIQTYVEGDALPKVIVPATTPEGGGQIQYDQELPVTPNSVVHVEVEVLSVDFSFNRGLKKGIQMTMDWLPPGKVK
jgi:hypothetical protein